MSGVKQAAAAHGGGCWLATRVKMLKPLDAFIKLMSWAGESCELGPMFGDEAGVVLGFGLAEHAFHSQHEKATSVDDLLNYVSTRVKLKKRGLQIINDFGAKIWLDVLCQKHTTSEPQHQHFALCSSGCLLNQFDNLQFPTCAVKCACLSTLWCSHIRASAAPSQTRCNWRLIAKWLHIEYNLMKLIHQPASDWIFTLTNWLSLCRKIYNQNYINQCANKQPRG